MENLKEEVKTYEEVFKQLRAETGKNDVNDMVETFMDYEYTNYSLFTFINEYANELEKLEKEKKQLLGDIDLLQNPPKEFDARTLRMKELKEQLTHYDHKLNIYNEKHEELMKIVNSLKVSIPNIFERLGCSVEDYVENGEIINLTECDEMNMLQYMSLIEKRTNDILQMYTEVFSNQNQEEHEDAHKLNSQPHIMDPVNTPLYGDFMTILKDLDTDFVTFNEKVRGKESGFVVQGKEGERMKEMDLEKYASVELDRLKQKRGRSKRM